MTADDDVSFTETEVSNKQSRSSLAGFWKDRVVSLL